MKYLKLKDVLEILPVSKSSIWQWVKDSKFPAPTKLSKRCSVWDSQAIEEFVKSKEASP